MSLRIKVLFWIIAVNLGIAALLWTAIHGSVKAQRAAHLRTLRKVSENREEIIKRLSNILLFEESLSRLEEKDITTRSIINWPEWKYFDDAVVLKKYVAFEGKIIYTDIELNPLGSRSRSPFFDRKAALRMLKAAIAKDRRVTEGDAIAIPIHVRKTFPAGSSAAGGGLPEPLPVRSGASGAVWGAAFVRPRFPEIGGENPFFDLTVFWVAMVGGTLVLIIATYVILSKVVIRPVEEMAAVAGAAARGEFSARCTATGSLDEVGRLIESFNYMVSEVGDYHRHLQEKIVEARERIHLAERHLAVAQRLASTGKLAAGIAHEINNPIGGMINAAIRLREEAEPGSRGEVYLDLIIEGLERIKNTVRKVLAFSPREMVPQRVRVGTILDDAAALISHRLEEKGIRLDVGVTPSDLDVVCEAGEIRQVVLNILLNSIDAIDSPGSGLAGEAEGRGRSAQGSFGAGKGVIKVNAYRDSVEKMVVIEIADNGCGMDSEELKRAFDLFFSTKPAGVGTGLGLSIAHNIVTGHKGRIEAESTPGEGTTVKVRLPED